MPSSWSAAWEEKPASSSPMHQVMMDMEYEARVADFAERMGVRTIFSSERFSENRGMTEDGKKIYSLSDAYPHADLVTYPSLIEGFGNAFLEALYYRKPIVVNNYAIYATDIRPKGFKVIEFDDYITEKTIQDTLRILDDPHIKQKCADSITHLPCAISLIKFCGVNSRFYWQMLSA